MYSYGPPHMAGQKQDDQLEHTFSSYVRIRDVALKTYQRRWAIGRSGKRGSGISVLAARHDDHNDESPQDSRTLLSILADFNNVIWMVSICPLISSYFSPLSKSLGSFRNAPVKIGITVTLIFYSFLNFLARSKYLSLFSLFFKKFTLLSAGTAKSIYM